MKSILFSTLNAKYIHSSLALRYLRAYCEVYSNLHIKIKEFTINEPMDDIMAAIYLQQPQILCFSCYIWNIRPILELAADYKKICPQTVIILGGPEVSYDAEQLLENNPAIDYIARGEGENTLQELLLALTEEEAVSQIEGITYRRDNQIYRNADRPLMKDLDSIPFPYSSDIQDIHDKIVYYESSRGCPYNCSYCLSSTQHGVRFFSLPRVKQDLAFLARQGIREIKFVDRTFNCHEERAMEIIQWIVGLETDTRFHFEIEASTLSARMMDFLATVPAGKFNLEIGIQSTFEPALQAVNRRSNWIKVRDNIVRLQSYHNFHIHLDLIAGLPFETYHDFARSFNDVYRLQPDVLQLGFLKMLKGSSVREMVSEHGYIFQTLPPYMVLANRYMDFAEMIKLQQIESLLDKYHNSADMKQSLAYIISKIYKDDAFGFFEKLALYWQTQGLFEQGHKKEFYYQYLLEFVRKYHDDHTDIINDLLKYDYIMNNRTRLPECLYSYNPDDVNQEVYGYIKDENFRRLYLSDKLEQSNREIRKNIHLEYFRYDPETAFFSPAMIKIIFIYDPVRRKVARKITV
ncbi:MAG: magnesium-protoporphyrin monomethyl ester oxidative cyclase [Firmicutes bacterium]|nr:magnesium-protoporphyrin monomethyl ester oxidative cyclase [Bacillota bacterium]